MVNYLLDTNAAIALLNKNMPIRNLITGNTVYVSSIVAGELFWGAENSGKQQANLKRVEDFLAEQNVLSCDVETAKWYGKIKAELRSKGRPIPQNDVWIAAIARQYALTVLTKDKHFENINDLKMQDW